MLHPLRKVIQALGGGLIRGRRRDILHPVGQISRGQRAGLGPGERLVGLEPAAQAAGLFLGAFAGFRRGFRLHAGGGLHPIRQFGRRRGGGRLHVLEPIRHFAGDGQIGRAGDGGRLSGQQAGASPQPFRFIAGGRFQRLAKRRGLAQCDRPLRRGGGLRRRRLDLGQFRHAHHIVVHQIAAVAVGEGFVGVQGFEPLAVHLGVVGAVLSVQDLGQQAVAFLAVGELMQDLGDQVGGFGAPAGFQQDTGQQGAEVQAFRVVGQGGAQLGLGLGVQLAFNIQARQSAAGEAGAAGQHAIAPAVQAPQFFLNGGVGGVGLEGALHVPQRGFQVGLVFAHDGHADVRHKIIRQGREHALENIGRVAVAALFEQRLAEMPIGIQALGVVGEDVLAVRDGVVELALLDQTIDLMQIRAQPDFCHRK